MRWPLHVIGACGLLLLAWVAACAKAPSKIPLAPWQPGAAYMMIEAGRFPAATVADEEPTEADLLEQLRYWRELRTWQAQQMDREVERLKRAAPSHRPVERALPGVSARPSRLPNRGIWSEAAERERRDWRTWADAQIARLRAE